MAFINGLYIFVTDESVTRDVEVSTHPVERGIDITDTVKRRPLKLSLSGKIVDYKDMKAANILSSIEAIKNNGTLINYIGRNAMSNMQISSFSTTHPYTNWGGLDFEMELQECRIAQSSYVEIAQSSVKDGGQQQVDKGENDKVYHTVKKGETVWGLIWEKTNGETADYRHLKREGAAANSWKEKILRRS